VVGGFEVLKDRIGAPERSPYIRVFKEVSNFSSGGMEKVKTDHLVGTGFTGTGEFWGDKSFRRMQGFSWESR
jgi:hypothetical protein